MLTPSFSRVKKTERTNGEPCKDGGFPYWSEASKIDSLRKRFISLSAINRVSMLNENSINSQDMHVANEHFFFFGLKLRGFAK